MSDWVRPTVGEVWVHRMSNYVSYRYLICEDHGRHINPAIDVYLMIEMESGVKDMIYIFSVDCDKWSKYDSAQ